MHRRLLRRVHVPVLPLLALVLLLGTLALSIEAAQHRAVNGDIGVQREVQSWRVPGVTHVVDSFNWLGHTLPMLALSLGIMTVLITAGHWRKALLLVPAVLTAGVNFLLKQTFESPRPTPQDVRITDPSSGFGFPSGHTMSAVVICVVLAYLVWRHLDHALLRRLTYLVMAAGVAGMGFSRIWSGAHWPTDVLGAMLWGTLYAGVAIMLYHRLHPRADRPADAALGAPVA